MKTSNKRISKRKYPDKQCRQCKMAFQASDARQVFCSDQHRIDFNNDQRRIKTASLNAFTNKLVNNEKILKKVFNALKNLKQDFIGQDILLYEGFDFEIFSGIGINNKNSKKIYWFLSHGIEGNIEPKKTFKIHKKD